MTTCTLVLALALLGCGIAVLSAPDVAKKSNEGADEKAALIHQLKELLKAKGRDQESESAGKRQYVAVNTDYMCFPKESYDASSSSYYYDSYYGSSSYYDSYYGSSSYYDPYYGSSSYYDPYYGSGSYYDPYYGSGSYYDPYYGSGSYYDPYYGSSSYYDPYYGSSSYDPYYGSSSFDPYYGSSSYYDPYYPSSDWYWRRSNSNKNKDKRDDLTPLYAGYKCGTNDWYNDEMQSCVWEYGCGFNLWDEAEMKGKRGKGGQRERRTQLMKTLDAKLKTARRSHDAPQGKVEANKDATANGNPNVRAGQAQENQRRAMAQRIKMAAMRRSRAERK